MRRSLAKLTLSAALLAGLSACAGVDVPGPSVPVLAALETPSVGTENQDAADDPAIWASASGPVALAGARVEGFVAGTDKKAGLYIYGLDGAVLQFLPDGLLNNVDLIEGFSAQGREQVLVGASDRGRMGIALYLYDPAATAADNAVRPWGLIPSDVVEPYGFCFGRRGDEIHAVLISKDGQVRQYRIAADAQGQPAATEVRRLAVGSISEGCVVDAEADALYIGEELVGLWRYGFDPASGDRRVAVATTDGVQLTADLEGLTLIHDGEARYLLASSQGDSTFAVWRVDGPEPVFINRFSVHDGGGAEAGIDGVTGTDGISARSGRVGERFPEGLVVVQDDVNTGGTQNFKYIDWRDIRAALGL